VENAEEIAAQAAQTAQPAQAAAQPQPTVAAPQDVVLPPPPPGGMPIPPVQEPELKVHLFIGGQNYGPYTREICKQLVTNGQLTPQTMAWMEGMPAWTPAGQIPAMQSLFAPATPQMPPMPPTGPAMPPMPPTMPPTM
ncbi:MAG: DUF4339 domain-containing protein, partial [Prevotella sp.]